MTDFSVSEQKNKNLREAMKRLGIRESDLKESFVHSGGPGGQNVNKVATCVMLFHPASGFRVKCQKSRSQSMNRYRARKMLIEKMDAKLRGTESEKVKRIAKIKRQKRKRSKRAKEKILEAKKAQSHKKKLRRPPGSLD